MFAVARTVESSAMRDFAFASRRTPGELVQPPACVLHADRDAVTSTAASAKEIRFEIQNCGRPRGSVPTSHKPRDAQLIATSVNRLALRIAIGLFLRFGV